MVINFDELLVNTKKAIETVDITNEVEKSVEKSKIKNGLCVVHSIHSTSAIIVNEHESGLIKDIVRKVSEDFKRGAGWLHDRIDDNAHSHLASTYIGPTRIFPIKDGKLVRGTWQNIFLLELDGPRKRKVIVEVMGE